MIIKYENYLPEIHESCFVAESSSVIGKVTLGEDSSIWYGAVLRGDVENIKIGQRTNVQDNVTIHVAKGFKTTIGDDVTIGHNAIVHGCTVGNRVLIGMGAIVLDGAIIEDDVIIGAGALIPPGKVITSKSLVVGSPGKVVKTLGDEAIQGLLDSAKGYVKEANSHKK
ncbi:gamma carbonic anhydrase family protein [Acidaminobacter sp. JC074]|uniref:gamma carbonic anhydrase family protein n=1 Tax=Acidaminobacter sp. JC074 TaxID=2530199 RepID=UPI001F0F5B22|nr:gamma carbonic anhydrase family protein [Acidaminobacter sp. JC074]MCH4888307.1 gamma carbonic anhydrase family protein [Acidaminobacter sp. JC074]